jgi:hypothetical protein
MMGKPETSTVERALAALVTLIENRFDEGE